MPAQPLTRPTDDKALYFPSWDCFCCQDSGIVPDYLVRMLDGYENYYCETHKNVLCTCVSSTRYASLYDAFDQSLTREQRQWFHDYVRDGWIATNKAIASGDPTHKEIVAKIAQFTQSF